MLIAVTGATGFLGSYITKRLCEDGHEQRVLVRKTSDTSLVKALGAETLEGDMRDLLSLEALVEGCDCVIHAAVGFAATRGRRQLANFEVNLLGSLRLMDLARRAEAQFIFVSTGAVHDKILDDRPLDEAHPLWPGSTYGAYKAAVEAFLPAYKEQFGFNGSAYRPTSIYGVHAAKPERSHWWSLVAKVLDGAPVETPHGGKVVCAQDVAEVVCRAVGREEVAGEVYELTDCHIYDRTVAEFAREAAGTDAEITGAVGKGPRHMIISDKAREAFGVGLDRGHEGVKAYIGELVELVKCNS